MKNIRAKLFVLLLALFVTMTGAQAQSIRLSHGFDVQRTFQDMDYNGYYNFNVAVTYEQILTNRFSVAVGARYGDRYIESFGLPEYSNWDSDYYQGIDFLRLSIPLEAEYKLPLSNRVRLFINGGLLFHFNHSFTSWMLEEGYYDYKTEQGEDHNWDASSKEICDFYGINRFSFGVGAGAGIEFGFLRLALQYDCDITNILKSSYNADYIDKYSNGKLNALTFNVGVRIGGNKLFRATSKSKTSTVNYPIDDSIEPTSQPVSTTAKVKANESKNSVRGKTQSSTESAVKPQTEAVESTHSSCKSTPFGWMRNFGLAIGTDTNFEDYVLPIFAITYEQRVWKYLSLTTAIMYRHVESPLNEYYEDYLSAGGYDLYGFGGGETITHKKIERITIPLNVEYKYLLSNKTRLYINAGVLFNWNRSIDGREYFNQQDGMEWLNPYQEEMKDFTIGGGVGGGVEFGNLRLGVQYDQDFQSVTDFNTDPHVSSLSIMLGWRFGGAKLYRRQSTVEQKSVTFPILEQ